MSLAETIIFESEDKAIEAVKNGADVNEWDRYGFRPLIEAVICKKFSLLPVLLQTGADIEQGDFINRTALQWAAARNEIEFCYYLLESGANPNHYSADGEPILAVPILNEQLETVELFLKYKANYQFAQDYISAKLLGHRFELTGEADIVSPDGKFIPLSFEGMNPKVSIGLIQRSLNNFVNSIPGQKFSSYSGKLKEVLSALKNAVQLAEIYSHKDRTLFQHVLDNIYNNQLLLLPVTHRGHELTFVKYKNLWAKCDRAVGTLTNTVVIYEIGNPYATSAELYNKILYTVKTKQFMAEEINQLLSLKTLITLPIKAQVTGNCTWANVEASIAAMTFMLGYNPQMHIGMRELTQLQKEVLQFYGSWVEWDQDSALDESMEDFEAADPARKLSKAIILGGILVQRCDARYKTHVARAKKILSILTQPNFGFIIENYCKIFYKDTAGKTGQRVKKLFKACGLDCKNITMKNPVPYMQANVHSENLVRMTTALHVACLQGDLVAVKRLVTEMHIDVDYLDRTGSTALMYAAYAGNLNIVKFLIESGANSNIKNLKGGTAARYAAYAGYQVIVDYLRH